MKKTITLNGIDHDCALIRTGEALELNTPDARFPCELNARGDGRYQVRAGTQSKEVHLAQFGDQVWVRVDGRSYQLQRTNPLDALAAAAAAGGDSTLSPMPGTILSVQVEAGQQVKAGETLLTMESMKLEVTLSAPHDGEIAEVFCTPGQTVPVKAALVRFAPKPEASA